MNEQLKSFCILPFYGKEIYHDEKTITCCIMEGCNATDKIKSDMLAGIQNPACNQCWKLEAIGKKSDRQIKNSTLDTLLDRDIRYIYDDCKQGKNITNFYKIFLGNICNAACTTCSGYFSSKWNKLENKKTPYYLSEEYLDKEIDYKNAVFISFLGGETLLQKNMYHVLSKLKQHNNTNCTIDIVSNGSIKPSKPLLELLQTFKDLSISISIDGIENFFNYLRWPLVWDQVTENIFYMKSENIKINAVITLSNMNVIHLEKLETWLKSNNILYHINPITSPLYMTPQVLPLSIKEKMTYGKEFIDMKNYESLFNEFTKIIRYQDKLKNIDIRNYIPEIGNYVYRE